MIDMSLLRYFHAIRHIPASRHVSRIVKRTQRKLIAIAPEQFFKIIDGLSRRLPDLDLQKRSIIFLADFVAGYTTESDLDPASEADGFCSVRILGRTERICIERPDLVVTGEGNNQLWKMSFGYHAALLSRLYKGEAAAWSIFLRLSRAFMSSVCWRSAGNFTHFWHPYSASHRLLNLIIGSAAYINAGGRVTSQEIDEISRIVAFHTVYVRRNLETDLGYNHLTKNLYALAVYDVATGGRVSPDIAAALIRSIEQQVLADGGHAELCPMYHVLFLADLLALACMGEAALGKELNSVVEAVAARMKEALRTMLFCDGRIALFGDSWFGEAISIPLLDADVPVVAGICLLPQTGLVKCQTGNVEIIADCGHAGPADNPGHAHDDFLSLEAMIDGSRVIRDYGVESYSRGAPRERTRGNTWHNGPQIEGLKGLDAWDSFRVGRRAGAPVVETLCTEDGWQHVSLVFAPLNAGASRVRRDIFLHTEYGFAVMDRWHNPPSGRQLSSFFLFDAAVASPDDSGLSLDLVSGAWKVRVEGDFTVELAQFFSVYGRSSPAVGLRLMPCETVQSPYVVLIVASTSVGEESLRDKARHARSATRSS